MNDLLFFVADKNMAEAVGGLLEREQIHRVIGCGQFNFDARRDIKIAAGHNDPGLYVRANELLRPLAPDYRHAVVIVDEEWEGSPGADDIARRLRQHLDDAGWSEANSLALVARPEADVWLWSDSPHSATALGWASWDALRPALEQRGLLVAGRMKPERPKEAAEWALRNCGHKAPRSAALYRRVSSQVSIHRCEDDALARLLNALRSWFPVERA
ncbi:hypothetical protein WME94_09210 [Sorangium sp. So ce429]